MRVRSMLLSSVGALMLWPAAAQTSRASEPYNSGPYKLSIPAAPLGDALNALAQQSSLQVLFSSQLVAHLSGPEIKGTLTAEEALTRLLAKSGLYFEFVNAHTITITAKPPATLKSSTITTTATATTPTPTPTPTPTRTDAGGGNAHCISINDRNTKGEGNVTHHGLLTRIASLFVACGAALPAGMARAQDSAAASTADAGTLQEVIVTANKRAENLQTVPLTVSVVSQESLQSQNLTDTFDLQRVVPDLMFQHRSTAGNESFGIRGVATQAQGPGLEQSVGVAFDGVPLGRNVGSLADLVDLQRVEVLKGPQGMLFGKNASAGLINIVTNTPDLGKTEEIFRVSYGTLNNRQYSGTVNLPISDSAAFRLSAWKFQHDGTTHEVNTGQDMNDKNSQGARLKFRLKPTDNLDLNFTGDWNSHHQNGTGYTIRAFIPANFTPANNGALIQAWELSHGTVPSDTNTTARSPNRPYFDVGHTGAYTGQADYSLGEGTLTALVSYRGVTSDNAYDPYPSDSPYSTQLKNEETVQYDQLSEEIRYASPTTQRLKYVVGLFNFRLKLADNLAIAQTTPGVNYNFLQDLHNTNYAAFGEATFDITSQLHFIAGLRRSTDKIDVGMNRTLAPGTPTVAGVNTAGSSNGPFAASTSASYDDLSWRTGLEFQVAPDAMLYATASKGYKGPAIGYTSSTTAATLLASNNGVVKPEIAHSFEVGLKSQWLDRRLTTNVAVYEEIFDNFQTVVVLPGGTFLTATENARQLKSTGIDLDASWVVTSDFSLTGSATYDNARFTDYTNSGCYTGQTVATGCVNRVQNLNGHRLANTPKTTTNLTARYEHPINSAWRGFLQANHAYRSDVSYSNAGDPYQVQGGYSLVNLNAGLNTSDGRWGVSIYANNVFDKHYVDVVVANQGGPFVLNNIGIQDFRTVGVAVNARL